MIDTPHIVQTEDQPCAIIHLVIPVAQIQQQMGAATGEIGAVLRTQGIKPTGPWFTHHLKIPDTHFDMEVSFPTATSIEPSGRVEPGLWPATRVARTVFHGNYSGLIAAWGEFMQWIAASGHTPAPAAIWEVYLTDPGSSPNPDDWQTELNIGLADFSQAQS